MIIIPYFQLLRKWWNWQTRYLEVVVRVIPLGGSSPPFRTLSSRRLRVFYLVVLQIFCFSNDTAIVGKFVLEAKVD